MVLDGDADVKLVHAAQDSRIKLTWKAKQSKQFGSIFDQEEEEEEEDYANEVIPIKRRCVAIEDKYGICTRLKDEGTFLAENERYWEALSKFQQAIDLLLEDVKSTTAAIEHEEADKQRTQSDELRTRGIASNSQDTRGIASNSQDTRGIASNSQELEDSAQTTSNENPIPNALNNNRTEVTGDVAGDTRRVNICDNCSNKPHTQLQEDRMLCAKVTPTVSRDVSVLHELSSQCYAELSEVYPATRSAERAVVYNEVSSVGYQTLARAQVNIGELKMACKSIQKAKHLDPSLEEADTDLQYILGLIGKAESTCWATLPVYTRPGIVCTRHMVPHA